MIEKIKNFILSLKEYFDLAEQRAMEPVHIDSRNHTPRNRTWNGL